MEAVARKLGLAQQGRAEQGEGEIQVEEKRRGRGEALRRHNAERAPGEQGIILSCLGGLDASLRVQAACSG